MLTYYNAEVVDDDQALGTPYNYHNKQFYAYTVDEPGPIVLVENKAAANHNLLGLTFPIKRPAKFTRQFINEEVLPRCREFFWQDNAGTSTTTTTTSAAEDKQNGNAGPTAADDQLDLSTLHPAQVYLMMPNSVELEFPKELTEVSWESLLNVTFIKAIISISHTGSAMRLSAHRPSAEDSAHVERDAPILQRER
jgi:hypothetical protein